MLVLDSSGLDLEESELVLSVVSDLFSSPDEPEFVAGALPSRVCVWMSTLTFAGGCAGACGVGFTMTGVEDGGGIAAGVCTSTFTGGAGVVIVVLETGTAVVPE